MPEGDVLRWTAARLDAGLAGQTVVRAQLRWPSVAGVAFDGRTVVGTHAYGKHLFTRFDDGRTLHTHLRMDGAWHVIRGEYRGSLDHVRALLATATTTAVGDHLGMVDVVATRAEDGLIAHLGPDILHEAFAEQLPEVLRRWRDRGSTPVGEVLLDQTVLAGIGTIYSAETLYARRMWPWTPADEVADVASVVMTARVLMQRSVVAAQHAGSPRPPGRVHGRRGRPCPRCGAPIRRGWARQPPQQRPMFYCEVCQRP